MKKIFCTIEEQFDIDDGDTVRLFEGPEIKKKYGVKRLYKTERGTIRYDNWNEWTIEKKEDLGIISFVLHLNHIRSQENHK